MTNSGRSMGYISIICACVLFFWQKDAVKSSTASHTRQRLDEAHELTIDPGIYHLDLSNLHLLVNCLGGPKLPNQSFPGASLRR